MVQTMGSPPFDLYAYQPPLSLWKLIEEYVPAHEKEEVKNMLGESLVDQSMELHDEIDILLDIWRDYREETTQLKPVTQLPEPPGQRERLVQEIQFFVENVKEKAKGQGVNPEKLLSRHNQEVLEYASEGSRPCSARPSSRQMTARSADGRETPMVTSPTCSDRASAASTLSEEVESMNDKLTVLKFDEVYQHLRQTLEEEIETMKQDIIFLQGCLDDEATFRAESQGTLSREPTLTDLREERNSLEKEMLSPMRTQISPTIKPAFDPHHQIKKLGPPVSADMKKISPVKISSQVLPPPRTGPMKAFSAAPMPKEQEQLEAQGRISSPKGLREQGQSSDRVSGSHVISHHCSPEKTSSGARPKTVERSEKQTRLLEDSQSEIRVINSIKAKPVIPKDTIGAVVTLTKGSENTEVHLIPSPPASAKPSNPPRPSSAQRFRKMVLNCRE